MAPIRKRDNRLGICRICLPPRPHRPLNTYTAFVQSYWARYKSGNAGKDGKPSIMAALEEWKKMDPITRKTFQLMANKDKDRYNAAMKEWNIARNMLKRPPNPYVIFSMEKWEKLAKEKKNGPRMTFKRMSKQISNDWKKLTANAYRKYEEQYKASMREHLQQLEELRNGSAESIEWGDFGELEDTQVEVEEGKEKNTLQKDTKTTAMASEKDENTMENMDHMDDCEEEYCPEDN